MAISTTDGGGKDDENDANGKSRLVNFVRVAGCLTCLHYEQASGGKNGDQDGDGKDGDKGN